MTALLMLMKGWTQLTAIKDNISLMTSPSSFHNNRYSAPIATLGNIGTIGKGRRGRNVVDMDKHVTNRRLQLDFTVMQCITVILDFAVMQNIIIKFSKWISL